MAPYNLKSLLPSTIICIARIVFERNFFLKKLNTDQMIATYTTILFLTEVGKKALPRQLFQPPWIKGLM
jgi:hypothetical protein